MDWRRPNDGNANHRLIQHLYLFLNRCASSERTSRLVIALDSAVKLRTSINLEAWGQMVDIGLIGEVIWPLKAWTLRLCFPQRVGDILICGPWMCWARAFRRNSQCLGPAMRCMPSTNVKWAVICSAITLFRTPVWMMDTLYRRNIHQLIAYCNTRWRSWNELNHPHVMPLCMSHEPKLSKLWFRHLETKSEACLSLIVHNLSRWPVCFVAYCANSMQA